MSQRMESSRQRTALITGASSGVGRAIALELAALGVAVMLLARDSQKLQSVAAEAQARGAEALVWPVDLTDAVALATVAREVKEAGRPIDFLVHSAGLFRYGPTASASLEDFDVLYRCNVRAPFALTQALLPQMLMAKGCVCFINSTAGETSHANVGQYAASKHALKAIADTLRMEVSPQGVRVLSVMLGRTATPMQEEVCRLEGSTYDGRKFLQPQDVARAVVNAMMLPASAEVTNLYIRPART
jgi:NADP-dependent 3-hydroxy acid dehydrogenase YdfG